MAQCALHMELFYPLVISRLIQTWHPSYAPCATVAKGQILFGPSVVTLEPNTKGRYTTITEMELFRALEYTNEKLARAGSLM